jgi:MoaA/NifB/PqqE/SkfB family radical SAM enzyme
MSTGSSDRLLYLMNDFVVQEHLCNLRCVYCLNFENDLKGTEPWVPSERVDLRAQGAGFERALRVLENCRARGDAPILRVSGGEILALAGGLDFIERIATDWDRVQVLTNATLLRGETLERLARLPGLNLCCSVDGHTPELNAFRTEQPRWAQRILDGLLGAVHAGLPVEVYTVLTSHNIEALYEFACFLAELPRTADLRLLPFPVRGEIAQRLAPWPNQLSSLDRLLADHPRLAPVLPPRAYLERLTSFYKQGGRSFRCRVPLSFLQTFDDGVVASCSNCWAVQLGNLLEPGGDVLREVGKAKIHKLFLRPKPRVPFCRGCFTPFDLINVYFDGDCSLEELARLDLYSSSNVQRRLALLKAAWQESPPRAVWSGPKPSRRRQAPSEVART